MEKVRAKFRCLSIEEDATNKTAKFMAIYGTEGENADFTKYTPSGELRIMIAKEAPASSFFVPGGDYYLDFTKA